MKNIPVLAFPGSNCDTETVRALRRSGFSSSSLRWNATLDFSAFDGLVISGGFSFEDRGRSGIIAAKDPVASAICEMAKKGKPILGICNGAQILVELGLVPGFSNEKGRIALSRNRRQKNGAILGSGFYHDTIFVRSGGQKNAWTNFKGVLQMPIAHAEGRFLASEETMDALKKNGQNALIYCDKNGNTDDHFPINPNGSAGNMAAVCNTTGTVMAMMPHPERSENGRKIFDSLRRFFESGFSFSAPHTPKEKVETEAIRVLPKYTLSFLVTLKITDTTEKTMEKTARRIFKNEDLHLTRRLFWGINTTEDPMTIAEKIAASDLFWNENKESVFLRVGSDFFVRQKKKWKKSSPKKFQNTLFALERDDIFGEEKSEHLKKYAHISVTVISGVCWEFSKKIADEEIIRSSLFTNPLSGILARI